MPNDVDGAVKTSAIQPMIGFQMIFLCEKDRFNQRYFSSKVKINHQRFF